MLIFQSTLPRRERPLLLILLKDGEHFNPRSHEGSDPSPRYLRCRSTHFNPRSRERSDIIDYATGLMAAKFQSTLPREERLQKQYGFEVLDSISIHAPARGATRAFILCSLSSVISIHAPARGATYLNHFIPPIYVYFNPRSRERSDLLNC